MDNLLQHAVDNGLCSRREYEAILFEVSTKSPCNVLVFGLGFDALLWIAAAGNGEVHFIENSQKWIDQCVPIPNVHKVRYNTKHLDKTTLHPPEVLDMDFPGDIEHIPWDVIFVDSPVGRTQGRMKSIYNAHRLAEQGEYCTVFVHDYDRAAEKLYVDHYFGQENVEVIDRLAKIQMFNDV